MKTSKNFHLWIAYAIILFFLSGLASAAAAETFFLNTDLSGFEEVPAVASNGGGNFQGILDSDAQMLDYQLTYENLSSTPSAAHIHFGQPGVNGGVIVFLCGAEGGQPCPESGTVSGTLSPQNVIGPEDQGIAPGDFRSMLRALLVGATYVNVHTAEFPAGEIRGQINSELDNSPAPPEPVE